MRNNHISYCQSAEATHRINMLIFDRIMLLQSSHFLFIAYSDIFITLSICKEKNMLILPTSCLTRPLSLTTPQTVIRLRCCWRYNLFCHSHLHNRPVIHKWDHALFWKMKACSPTLQRDSEQRRGKSLVSSSSSTSFIIQHYTKGTVGSCHFFFISFFFSMDVVLAAQTHLAGQAVNE